MLLAVIAQISNPTIKLVIPIGIARKEAKVEIETDPVTAELRNFLIQYILLRTFLCFYSLTRFSSFP